MSGELVPRLRGRTIVEAEIVSAPWEESVLVLHFEDGEAVEVHGDIDVFTEHALVDLRWR